MARRKRRTSSGAYMLPFLLRVVVPLVLIIAVLSWLAWDPPHVGAKVGVLLASLLASIYLIPLFIRITVPFRGLLVPLLPLNPHVKLRVALRINSYLPRWTGAVTFLGAWSVGLALAYGVNALLHIRSNTVLITSLSGFGLIFVAGYAFWARGFYQDMLTKEQARIQRRRDRRAAEMVTMARRNSLGNNRYSVWLRPFSSTGRCWVIARSRKYKLKSEPAEKEGWYVEFTDLETLLAAVIEAIAPLIALGASGEQVGAGRADTTEKSWRDTFIVLARSAHAIFLLPSLKKGTRWELEFLLKEPELLRRVIFVLPPDSLDKISSPGGGLVIRGTVALTGSQETTFLRERSPILRSGYRDPASEMSAAREEAVHAFSEILEPDGYSKVRRATDGALIQLSNDPRPKIIAMAELRTADVLFPFQLNWGPRFDQQLFRKQVLRILSGWSPTLARLGHEPIFHDLSGRGNVARALTRWPSSRWKHGLSEELFLHRVARWLRR